MCWTVEIVDKGHWEVQGEHYDEEGPFASFRWYDADRVDIKNFSVSEIKPLLSNEDI